MSKVYDVRILRYRIRKSEFVAKTQFLWRIVRIGNLSLNSLDFLPGVYKPTIHCLNTHGNSEKIKNLKSKRIEITQRMRLKRRLCGVNTVCFLVLRIPRNCKLSLLSLPLKQNKKPYSFMAEYLS